MQPHRRQPTRLPHPWDSPGKNTGVGCHFLLQCMKVKSESKVAQSCLILVTPWTAAYQAPPSMGFSRQKYWSGVPLPSPKKAECWRIDAYELWSWRRLLRDLWTAKRSNQSILKEASPGYSLDGLMLRLKLQYFDHLMRRVDSLEKTLMLGKILSISDEIYSSNGPTRKKGRYYYHNPHFTAGIPANRDGNS